jgi:hypothetical protein
MVLFALRPFGPRGGRAVVEIAPRRRVHLYTRAHIDLQRVAGALCRA